MQLCAVVRCCLFSSFSHPLSLSYRKSEWRKRLLHALIPSGIHTYDNSSCSALLAQQKIGDKNSPLIYLLRPKPGDAKMYTIDLLASEIEAIGSLSVEDVIHVMKSFVRAMRKVLVSGDKVKVDGLGIFIPH